MARLSIEDAGTRSPREARDGSRDAQATSGKSPKQAIMIGVAVAALATAGVLVYMNTAETPRPGDQVSYETTADPATPAAQSGPAPAGAPTPTVKKLAVDTPPVPETVTTAGPGSRKVGGPR